MSVTVKSLVHDTLGLALGLLHIQLQLRIWVLTPRVTWQLPWMSCWPTTCELSELPCRLLLDVGSNGFRHVMQKSELNG